MITFTVYEENRPKAVARSLEALPFDIWTEQSNAIASLHLGKVPVLPSAETWRRDFGPRPDRSAEELR